MRTTTRRISTAVATAALAAAVTAPAFAAQTDSLESIAHRGDKEHHPDNSVAGIRSAVDKGADLVEIDVIYNPDGDTFFLNHDNRCSGPGGSATIDRDAYEVVTERCALPELDDVLATYGSEGYLSFVVEYKSTSRTTTESADDLVETIEAAGAIDDMWVSSLDDDLLAAVRDTGTDISLMRVRGYSGPINVGDAWLRETAELGYDAANVNIGAWTRAKADLAESLGLETVGWAWPTASEGDNTTAIEYDLDMFMTDRLDDLHAQLGR
ncbi:glycerophosphodiester phosphodiesterase [Georgenia sp. Z1344]|uniref:glycerophosphodiester phosphodiesterase n=1 Tax=Georgenia sp. Z1344 TaxID=3416706 RepID=UPI003CF47081